MARIEARLNQKTSAIVQTNRNRWKTIRRRLPLLDRLIHFHFYKLCRFAFANPRLPIKELRSTNPALTTERCHRLPT